ncbi:hypothetical protein [Dyella amyloliquefaciens]|uniref:hypothetical protein n=1 Tax=Dyella amyloliquefaciens TaxID=1770545 RepID=UPI00102EAE24|nr:hypothetical protein [Dyella amyloliquefaciens]
MNKTYEVVFRDGTLPGVFAVGGVRRTQSIDVPAAEAVRLVDVKGLAFANPDDERAARAELAPASAPLPAPTPETHEEA